jgi:hypothetical protein
MLNFFGIGSSRRLLPLSIFALLALVVACGDSGGGSSSADVGGTGSVALLLTDAPTDEFVQVLVTVTQIDLLPGEGDEHDEGTERETIFEGRETFDLLALENVSEPFAIADDIPAGFYSKFRMDVEEIELVRMDGDGGFESVFPRLPGGDRIDLNSQGGFHVAPGEMLAVRLDIDAHNSIHINETGNGEYLFRPQVFVDVLAARDPDRLIFVEGVVQEIDHAASPVRIWLCQVEISHRSAAGLSDEHCLTVFADDETSVFDDSGLPSDLGDIDVEDRIGVLGGYTLDDEDRFAIDAEIIELGGSAAFLTLTGVVSDDDDPISGNVVLDLDPGQGFADGSVVEIEIFDETRILSSSGEARDRDDIAVGDGLEVDGVLVLFLDSPDLIRAAVIFVEEASIPVEP